MSLLLDALKRAEKSKIGKLEGMPSSAPPASSAPPGSEPAAAGALGLEPLPGKVAAAPKPAPKSASIQTPQAAQAAARRVHAATQENLRAGAKNLFAVKQAGAPGQAGSAGSEPLEKKFSKSFLVTLGVLIPLGLVGGGGYVWWQLQPPAINLPSPPASVRRPPPPPPPPSAPAAATATAPVPVKSPPAAAVAAPAATDATAEKTKAAEPSTRRTLSRRVTADDAAAAAAPARAANDGPIRVGVAVKPALDAALVRGWNAFNAADLDAARRAYTEALKNDPASRDALHGLAAIELRQGRPDRAEQAYARALAADPKDAIALAGWTGLRGGEADESLLKSRIAAQPNQPALQFALGNVYAGEGRWNEAQQAYFNAVAQDSTQPDYLYNLAVSLEHLRQPALALRYYGEALAAAAKTPASFDAAAVKARVDALRK